jgi:TatD DNase family protein
MFKEGWVDTHAHLDCYDSKKRVKEIVDRADEQGVVGIITAADSPESAKFAVDIAENFDGVYAAVGVHPNEISLFNKKFEKELYKLAGHEKVVAIGEIGLDYYRDVYPHSDQQKTFQSQLEIAMELNLPIIVHNREADKHVLSILEKVEFPAEKVVLHCFNAEESIADEVIDRDYYVSLSAIITYGSRNDSIGKVLNKISEKRILLETDSPFLPPHPHRGKTNEPSYLPLIGNKIAEIRGIEPDKLRAFTRENANRLFFNA